LGPFALTVADATNDGGGRWTVVDANHDQTVTGTLSGDLLPGEVLAFVSHPDTRNFLHYQAVDGRRFVGTASVGCLTSTYPSYEHFEVWLVPPLLAGRVSVRPACGRPQWPASDWEAVRAGSTKLGEVWIHRVLPSAATPSPPATTTPPPPATTAPPTTAVPPPSIAPLTTPPPTTVPTTPTPSVPGAESSP
jgi:hypothetical protein